MYRKNVITFYFSFLDTNAALKPSSSDHSERLQEVRHQKQRQEDRLQEVRHQKQRQEERQRYMDMARQREEIINMLHQQRQKRIQRETVSLLYKPRQRDRNERYVTLCVWCAFVCVPLKLQSKSVCLFVCVCDRLALNPPEHLETDVEEVRRLQ
uniref:Cilia- and flagella-associated protein HOATZ n=1 Tax=Hucho hucho TaxID=62062 RepID=A0A4W5KP19_9TELE